MDVPFLVWALTIAVIAGMLILDFVGHVRTPHAPSLRESAIWSAVYVGAAVVFGPVVASATALGSPSSRPRVRAWGAQRAASASRCRVALARA